MPPPAWALLERELIGAQTEAIEVFFEKYFDERGYLLCVPRWGGLDGPDDAGENLLNWTMLYALGAPERVLELYRKGWEGHLRQYTEARTTEVPLAREGMYYKEFPVSFDWFHHGEWLSAFILEGLCDPSDPVYEIRSRRYAGFYMNEDPQAPNYDRHHRIIRSMFNGSRGPLLRKATPLDWVGDPIEIEGRFRPGHGEASYEQMLARFEEYTDIVGDHPLNLGATNLAFIASALTGEGKYRDWLLEYVDAWIERTRANDGIIPTNIGLDGSIGGECDGKWYGGVYGWGAWGIDGHTWTRSPRQFFLGRAEYGFGNAYLLTGDRRYPATWGDMIDRINAEAKEVDGEMMYPRCFGDEGWHHFLPEPFSAGAWEVYYWTMAEEDRQRVPSSPWLEYLEGHKPDYPINALADSFALLRIKMEGLRADTSSRDTRMSDDMNKFNPATTEVLTQLMLGGIPTGRVGSPLHCRLRYFDPERRRAGVPEDVGALVEKLTHSETTVQLVNLNPTSERTVIVQGGAYGEHRILSARMGGREASVGSRSLAVRLAPGSGGTLELKMRRYANKPTMRLPFF